MINMMKTLSVALLAALLLGCATAEHQPAPSHKPKQKGVHFNEIIVKNTGHSNIENLSIRVSKTQGVFSCGLLLAKSFCSNKFKSRKYEGNAVTLNWAEDGIQISKGPIVIKPLESQQNGLYTIVLEFDGAGQLSTEFRLQNSNN